MLKLYLDVCCLNRPFDDLSQLRVATEALAVERIFALIDAGEIELFSSDMAWLEIERIEDKDRRKKVSALMPPKARTLTLSDELFEVAERFQRLGPSAADAVHLAAAVKLKVDRFVTTDDRLLRKIKRHEKRIKVTCLGPAELVKEFERGNDR